jgi:hypothetical protein
MLHLESEDAEKTCLWSPLHDDGLASLHNARTDPDVPHLHPAPTKQKKQNTLQKQRTSAGPGVPHLLAYSQISRVPALHDIKHHKSFPERHVENKIDRSQMYSLASSHGRGPAAGEDLQQCTESIEIKPLYKALALTHQTIP